MPSIYTRKKRIVAIGDLHGDWNATITSFKVAKLIDNNFNWIAIPKSTFVVQLGDQVDRLSRTNLKTDEASEKKIFDFLDNLHKQASSYGGAVLSIIGNHELMNVMGDMRYASPMSIKDFGTIYDRIDAFKPGGEIARRFACTRNVIIKIGNFLFVHGGILPKHCKLSIQEINRIMKNYLLNKINTENHKYFDQLFLEENSLLWTRKLSGENVKCSKLNKVFKTYNVNNIVVGHTPQLNGITSECSNKIWRVDTGMSRAFSNKPIIQVLEILDNGMAKKSNNFKPIRILN